ncbi:MAG: glutamine--tRNA ligase/YqeY domain fusion protein [Pseudomonadota bacterium]
MTETTPARDFIRQRIDADNESGRYDRRVVTRFPPEPNGYLHIGHAKSICINFGIANEFAGQTYLRYDDTNPGKESSEFVAAIERDVRWLGFEWTAGLTHASDHFERLYEAAERLIETDHAYVDSLDAQQMRAHRGTLTESGKNSPYRDRSIEENLDLFRRMRAGEFADGEHVLRARIDMASPNLNLRDPTLYRIRHVAHQRTGAQWCIYPMYDFAHTLSDAFEGITHSLCTLEFEDHRPLYDWLLETLAVEHRPQQIEFSRLNVAYFLTSKRKLAELVDEGYVDGWDDPRMPTLAGLRRRGVPPAAVRDFVARVGVTKKENVIEQGLLETCIRGELGESAPRVMGVVNPLKVTLTNYPVERTETVRAKNHPARPEMGERDLAFGRELYIERDDFMEDAPRKFFRLKPGGEVRLRYAYIIRCDEVVKDDAGEVIELRCHVDESTKSGSPNAERKVKGTIHWVAAHDHAVVEARLYDRLFAVAEPGRAENFRDVINPESLIVTTARVESSLAAADPAVVYQFERVGYFKLDSVVTDQPAVFNRVVTLRDSWAKAEQQALATINT